MNKTILVTGASGKIGFEIFKELVSRNFNLIGTYSKNKIKIKKKNNSQKIYLKKLDQSNEKNIKDLLRFISKQKLDLVGVVNCSVLRPMKKVQMIHLKIGKNL